MQVVSDIVCTKWIIYHKINKTPVSNTVVLKYGSSKFGIIYHFIKKNENITATYANIAEWNMLQVLL